MNTEDRNNRETSLATDEHRLPGVTSAIQERHTAGQQQSKRGGMSQFSALWAILPLIREMAAL